MRLRTRAEDLFCLIILLAVALSALAPAVFQGRLPFSTHSALFQTPWEAGRPENMQRPMDAWELTQANRYYAWYVYMSAAAGGDGSILWNPLEGCGQPLMAVWRTRCLSPFSLPFYVLDVNTAITLSFLLKLLVAGGAAYYAARRLGFKPPLALAAAVAFQLSGHIYLWLGWPMSDVLPLLPLLVLCTERLAVGQARCWTVGAIVLALMALGGDPETLAGAVLFCAVYFFIRVALQRSSSGPAASVAAFAAVAVFGLLLAAVQVIPYAEFLSQAANTGSDDSPTTLRIADLALAYLPRFLGRSIGIWTSEGVLRHARVIRLLYVGLAQLMLLPVWFSVRSFVAAPLRRRTEALLWTVLVMACLAMAAGRALTRVPLLGALGPQHLLAGNALAVALAASATVEEWLLLNAQQCWRAIRRLFIYLPLLLMIGAAAAIAHQNTPRMDMPALWLQAIKSGLVLLVLLVLLAVTVLRPSHRLFGYALAALTGVSLFTAWTPGLRYVDTHLVFPDTALVQSLRSVGARIGGSDGLAQWPLAAELVPQVYAPGGVTLRRQQVFLDRLRQQPLLLRRAGAQDWLLTREDIQGEFAPVRPMLSIERVFPSGAVLFSDLEGKPRAWISYDARQTADTDPAAIGADLPPTVETAVPIAASPPGPDGTVSIAASTATHVSLAVETTRPGTVMLADTFYPGWRARLDGKDVPVLPADSMFRAVPVEAGTHQLDFYYAPASVRIGLYISLVAAAVVLIELRRVFWQAYY